MEGTRPGAETLASSVLRVAGSVQFEAATSELLVAW